MKPMKRRYIVASLAFLGFCVIYMLRVNLSVAIVAMTANRTHEPGDGSGQIAVVRIFFKSQRTGSPQENNRRRRSSNIKIAISSLSLMFSNSSTFSLTGGLFSSSGPI